MARLSFVTFRPRPESFTRPVLTWALGPGSCLIHRPVQSGMRLAL